MQGGNSDALQTNGNPMLLILSGHPVPDLMTHVPGSTHNTTFDTVNGGNALVSLALSYTMKLNHLPKLPTSNNPGFIQFEPKTPQVSYT